TDRKRAEEKPTEADEAAPRGAGEPGADDEARGGDSAPLFSALTPGGERNFLDTLRGETIGGVLLLIGAVVALVWANSPWQDSYTAIRDTRLTIDAIGLDLSVGEWAADGLLAVFFFVVGVELKREIVTGELRPMS